MLQRTVRLSALRPSLLGLHVRTLTAKVDVPQKSQTPSSVAPLANTSRAIFGEAKKRFGSASDSSSTGGDNTGFGIDAVTEGISAERPRDEQGNAIIYKGNQNTVVQMLFGASSFNFVYWTYYTTSAWYYQGVEVQGIELGGDVRWGALGAFCTGLMFYATKTFKDNACMMAYVVEAKEGSGEADRIGFQMHNFIGGPGKRIECNIGNVRQLDAGKKDAMRFGSSFMPIRVKGVSKNVLIDEKGEFYWNGRFRDILKKNLNVPASVVRDSEDDAYFAGEIDSKERRKQFFNGQKGKGAKKR